MFARTLDMGKSKAFMLTEKDPASDDEMRAKLQRVLDNEPVPDKTLWNTSNFLHNGDEYKTVTATLWYYAADSMTAALPSK